MPNSDLIAPKEITFTELDERIDIMYVATHGFAARMLFQTGLLAKLSARGFRVAVVVPDATDRNLVEICAKTGVRLIEIRGEDSPRYVQTMQFRKYFLTDLNKNPAVLEKHMQRVLTPGRSFGRRANTKIGWWIYQLVKKVPVVSRLYLKLEAILLKSSRIFGELEKHRPRLLVATYPIFSPEYQLLAAARELKIASVLHLLSWDNIASKEPFPASADDYIVWGEVMERELKDIYEVPKGRIYQCGVPHFDLHLKTRELAKNSPYFQESGIDVNKPFLFFGMSAPRFSPREIDIVEWLANQVAMGEFGAEMQLLVRPHPQNMIGHMADLNWVNRIAKLDELERVAVNYPRLVAGSKVPWSMEQEDMVVLSALIAKSAVVLNSGSTISIDGLMQERPVVLTSFDAHEELPYWRSARRLIDFIHLKKLVDMGGVTVVRDFTDLTKAINTYLANPEYLLAERKTTLRKECFNPDGKATDRVVNVISQLLETVTVREKNN